ncbi:serine/threonine protein kinase [Chloroflexota bacterium]
MTQPKTDAFIGRQFDEYRITSLLGKGNMAAIYLAEDDRLKRLAAIKVIIRGFSTDEEYTMRFEREARAIAQLNHQHIVQLYRYGEVEGVLYMAMQYIEGASLALVLESYKEDRAYIETDEAARIVREIGGALDYAHEEGVIHRDVKPPNIMLNTKGKAILTDFGLVLIKADGTRGGVLGTPHYLAPEQAMSSAKATAQSDLYSMGVIMYEMFTNIRPFESKKPIEVAMMHITKEPVSPREHRPALSEEVAQVICKAIAKNPKDRYQSGVEMSAALDEALKTGGIGPATGDAPAPAPAGTILSRTLAFPLPDDVKAQLQAPDLPPGPDAAELEAWD